MVRPRRIFVRDRQAVWQAARAADQNEILALYKQHWLIKRLGSEPPVQVRQRLALQPAAEFGGCYLSNKSGPVQQTGSGETGTGFERLFVGVHSLSNLPPGKARQYLLSALSAPDQTAFLPHPIQDAGDGRALDLDVFRSLRVVISWRRTPLLVRRRSPFQRDVSVSSDLRYYPRVENGASPSETMARGTGSAVSHH